MTDSTAVQSETLRAPEIRTDRPWEKLRRSIIRAEARVKDYRANRTAAINQYTGRFYMDSPGQNVRMPMNMLHLAVSVWAPQMTSGYPKVRIKTDTKEFKAYAHALELSIDQMVREVDLRHTLQQWAYDFFFGYAIAKVGLYDVGKIDILGEAVPVCNAFADRISPDDHIFSPTATDIRQAAWEGNFFTMDYDLAMEAALYGDVTGETAVTGSTDARGISKHQSDDGMDKEVELVDVWLRKENVVVTVGMHGLTRPRREVGCDLPDGPYITAGIATVPDNPFWLPLASEMRDLNSMINKLAVGIVRRLERAKTLGVYDKGDDEDADVVRRAEDGDLVGLTDSKSITSLTIGSEAPPQAAVLQYLVGLFSRVAFNVDTMGGLAANARTATEARIVGGNAQSKAISMREEIEDFTRRIIKSLAYYEHTDPLMVRRVVKKLPGTPIEIPVLITPQYRTGDFLDYNFEFVPYSMSPTDPQEALNNAVTWFTQIVMPGVQLAIQQGTKVDLGAIYKALGARMDVDDLEDFISNTAGDLMPFTQGKDMFAQNFLGGSIKSSGSGTPDFGTPSSPTGATDMLSGRTVGAGTGGVA